MEESNTKLSNTNRIIKYWKGGGACFACIARQHKHDICLFIANDIDSILYTLKSHIPRRKTD